MNAEELAQAKMGKLGDGEMVTVTFCDSGRLPEIWLRGAVAASDDAIVAVEIGAGRDDTSKLCWRSGQVSDVGILHSGFRKRTLAEGRVTVRWLQQGGGFRCGEIATR